MKQITAYVQGVGIVLVFALLGACTPKVPAVLQTGTPLNQQVTSHEGEIMLLGAINRQGLQSPPFKGWYDPTYQEYTVRLSALGGVSQALRDVEIVVFMGTWCSDSQLEVPQFYKILDALKFPESKLSMYAVDNHPDRNKTTPGGESKTYAIEYVPTFIFLRKGKEIGRIVEYPKKSMEADMADLLK